jgi:hypothetical protein
MDFLNELIQSGIIKDTTNYGSNFGPMSMNMPNPMYIGGPFDQNNVQAMYKKLLMGKNFNTPELSSAPNFTRVYPAPALIPSNPMLANMPQPVDPNVGEMFRGAFNKGISGKDIMSSAGGQVKEGLEEFANKMVGAKGNAAAATSPAVTGATGVPLDAAAGMSSSGGAASKAGAGFMANIKSGGKALGGLAGKAVKYAPYAGGALMAGQALGDTLETGKIEEEIRQLAGDIGLTARGTPMLGEFLDPATMREIEKLSRRGTSTPQNKIASGVKGALGEIPSALGTTALIALLTGGASIPMSLAFGAGQLGLGATKGMKNDSEAERQKLTELYSRLSEAKQMSRGAMKPSTQNYNTRYY